MIGSNEQQLSWFWHICKIFLQNS